MDRIDTLKKIADKAADAIVRTGDKIASSRLVDTAIVLIIVVAVLLVEMTLGALCIASQLMRQRSHSQRNAAYIATIADTRAYSRSRPTEEDDADTMASFTLTAEDTAARVRRWNEAVSRGDCREEPESADTPPESQETPLESPNSASGEKPVIGRTDENLPKYAILEPSAATATSMGTATSVSRYPAITADERETLARLVWLEAGGEPFESQRMIAEVVLNRLISPYFPDTIDGVVYQREPCVQFAPAHRIGSVTPTQRQYDAVDAALSGDWILPTGVVYFSNAAITSRVWGNMGKIVFCYL